MSATIARASHAARQLAERATAPAAPEPDALTIATGAGAAMRAAADAGDDAAAYVSASPSRSRNAEATSTESDSTPPSSDNPRRAGHGGREPGAFTTACWEAGASTY